VKKIVFPLLFTIPFCGVFAQFKPVDETSSVRFSIKNFGIPVSGSFAGLEGRIAFDPSHPEEAVFKMTVKSSSVNTGNELRDSHLKKDSYFDAEHFPVISFSSARTLRGKDGMLVVYGMLNIKNHTKEIAIPFNVVARASGYQFNGQFSINRKEFGLGGNSIIADNAVVTVSVTTVKE